MKFYIKIILFLRLMTFSLFASVFLFPVCEGSALPINSDLGLTPHKGEFIFRVQARYTLKSSAPASPDREMEIYAVPVVGVYGFTSKASVLVKIPYVNKELRTAGGPDRGCGRCRRIGRHDHRRQCGQQRQAARLGRRFSDRPGC